MELEDILELLLCSHDGQRLCRVAVRRIRLQALAGGDARWLVRLVASALTDCGASIIEINTAFCRSVTSSILQALPPMPALQVLNLDGCQEVDDDGLIALAAKCTSLLVLSLYWNVRATDKGFSRLLRAQQGKNLRTVSFSGCKHLSDNAVQRLVAKAPKVEVLDLTRCPKVTDSGLLLVCECLEHLRVLRLYAMAQLSAEAFAALPRLVKLEELDLCGCRVEDTHLVKLLDAAAPAKLHTLNLTWCPALTDVAALAVARSCPQLQWLSYFGNTNMTGAAVEALASAACGAHIHSLDVRGLKQAPEYSSNSASLRHLFPCLVHTELHH